MCMRDRLPGFLRGVLALLLGSVASIQAQEHPGLGQALSADEVAEIDYVVLADGDGLPTGSGTVGEGETLYREQCVACHGEQGQGGPNDRLVGGVGSIGTDTPVKTVGSYWPYATTLFDYVRRAMPYQTPGSLSADEVYALTAYLLHLNGIVGADARLDAASLPVIEMPNRDGFVWAVP
jgi:mono/diheme cytochrome c family protein